jgi:hypothetical protein
MPNIRTIVPPAYYYYVKIFEKDNMNKLPPHYPSNHTIPLMDSFKPLFGPLYSLYGPELEELKCWLDENLSQGFIRASSSPTTTPILIVKQGDGFLRLVVDYRGMNEGAIKNRHPLLLLQDTLMNLSKAKSFNKLDIRGVHNLICMAKGKEWKTAFYTCYGVFESLVMPFSLSNALATFQNYINNVLAPYLDRFCAAYLNDTLMDSDNFEQHQQHVRLVFHTFAKACLHLKPEKFQCHQQEVKYLWLIISTEGMKMDPKNKDVRGFLEFANFYCRFICNYSRIVQPLTFLTGKGVPFTCSMEQQMAFDTLKVILTSAPVLAHFDADRDVIVEKMLLITSPPGYYLNTMTTMSFTLWPIFQKNIPPRNIITKFMIKN